MDGAQQTDGGTGMSALELKENLHRENYRLPTKLACELFTASLNEIQF